MTSTEAAKRLRLSPTTFKWQARRLNIGTVTSKGPRGRVRREFSEDDLDKLRELTCPPGLVNIADAARCLELSKSQVREYARTLGIKPRPPFMYLFFTPDEVERIRVAQEEAIARVQHRRRQAQHDALFSSSERDTYDYHGNLRAFTIAGAIVQDPELSSELEGPQMSTLQWHAFYPATELDPDDNDTSKWGSPRDNRKWISFEELQEWHPDFMKDRY